MDLDDFIKYAIWVIFFSVALFGIYLILKKLGIV